MKKKIIAMAIVVCVAVIAFTGASLAYFTDTESARVNSFAVGHVKVELIEQERNAEGALVEFTDGKALYPAVGQIAERTADGLPVGLNNFEDKLVTVKNTGKLSSAYVRVLVAVPQDLDNGEMLHIDRDPSATKWTASNDYVVVTVNGAQYNVYTYTYSDALEVGVTTEGSAITGVYLDSAVDVKAVVPGEGTDVTVTYFKGENEATVKNGAVEIHVRALAVQTEGFTDANTALNTVFPTNSYQNFFPAEDPAGN